MLAFAESSAPLLVEPFLRVSDAWTRRFALAVMLKLLTGQAHAHWLELLGFQRLAVA